MNEKEAIDRIRDHNMIHSKKEPYTPLLNEAMCMAIDTLEKQIPKKIAYQEYDFDGKKIRINGIDGVPYDLCPNCGTNLCTTGFVARKKMNYCQDCGQRLDWNK